MPRIFQTCVYYKQMRKHKLQERESCVCFMQFYLFIPVSVALDVIKCVRILI